MKVTASAVSLNIEDVAASSRFLHQHFGFTEVMAAGGFASLARHDIGMNVVCSRRGLPALPGDQRDVHAGGLIVVFAVGLESQLARLPAEGAPITMPLTCEGSGGGPSGCPRPDGVIVQLAGWNAPTATGQSAMTCSGASAGHDQEREHERDVASGPCVISSIPPPLCSPPAPAPPSYAAGLHACSLGAGEAASLGPGPGPEPA